jgi:hypothetical protein
MGKWSKIMSHIQLPRQDDVESCTMMHQRKTIRRGLDMSQHQESKTETIAQSLQDITILIKEAISTKQRLPSRSLIRRDWTQPSALEDSTESRGLGRDNPHRCAAHRESVGCTPKVAASRHTEVCCWNEGGGLC